MDNDLNKIKPSQYMFLIAAFICGSILLLSFFVKPSRQDTWFVILLSFLVIAPFIAVYVFIGKRFPGKSLIEIHDIVYGKILGKLISILYILFFLLLLSLNIRNISTFIANFFMPETPPVIFMILFTLCCAYAVKKGIQTIARISYTMVILIISIVILTFLLLLGQMDFSNFLPVLNLSFKDLVQSTSTAAVVIFGEVVIFLMVIPYVSNHKKLLQYSLKGTGISALVFIIIAIRSIAVLGEARILFEQAPIQTVRFINIGEFLTRVELLIFLNSATGTFIKTSVLYFVTVKSVSQLLNLKSIGPLIIPIGIIAVASALNTFSSTIAHRIWGESYLVFFELPFTIVFPLLTSIIIKIRKIPKANPCNLDNPLNASFKGY